MLTYADNHLNAVLTSFIKTQRILREITPHYNLWIPNMFIETANNTSAIILNGSGHSKNDVIKFPNQEGISNFLSEACVVSQSRGGQWSGYLISSTQSLHLSTKSRPQVRKPS